MSYGSVINACARSGEVSRAEQWLVTMLDARPASRAALERATASTPVEREKRFGVPFHLYMLHKTQVAVLSERVWKQVSNIHTSIPDHLDTSNGK